jgi:hypothetical protein
MKTLPQLACVCAAVLAACATTAIVSTWKKPGLSTISFQNIVVVAGASDPSTRRKAEDRLVQRLRIPAVASYTLTAAGPVDQELRGLVRKGNFDGAIVVRVIAVEKESVWVPGTSSGPYYGQLGWPMSDRGYMATDTYVRVETNVFRLPDEELLWAASSKTVNPTGLNEVIDETIDAVAAELKKQGLIAPVIAQRQ